jgi:hypothetical protein
VALVTVSGCAGLAGAAASPSSSKATSKVVPATSPSPSTTSPAVLTLGDQGIGGLGLGMTKAQARATGLVGRPLDYPVGVYGECSVNHGKRWVARVYFLHGKVTIIAIKASIKLDTGIGVGDTYQKLHVKYPDASGSGGGDLGRLTAPAPGAAVSAAYRFGLSTSAAFPDSKITEIALQANDQACYE